MLILHQYMNIEISTNFEIVSKNFYDVISMSENSTLFRRNFDGWKIEVISMDYSRNNFDDRKFHVVLMYFFNAILMQLHLRGAYLHVFLKDKIW